MKIARFPKNTEQGFRDAVAFLMRAKSLQDVRNVRAFNLEKYTEGKYKGMYSIRCDRQFRLMMDIETDPGLILILEEVIDPH
ncbi:MAG: type II toxin-antitoxin system RelE/ParE family toxin [Candidatus Peribacteria bacterium]|jgi:plasmid maintenance system killer protein|nr:type II toxin-antitoxin system RelE/ParE family toxin [Candidatus Peribacteria bacterium]